MAGEAPHGWFTPEGVREIVRMARDAGGLMALGAVLLAIAIKRGFAFVTDPSKLLVALAVAERDLAHEKKEVARLAAELAERDLDVALLKQQIAQQPAPQ